MASESSALLDLSMLFPGVSHAFRLLKPVVQLELELDSPARIDPDISEAISPRLLTGRDNFLISFALNQIF